MLVLVLRTDKPEAEVKLYENDRELAVVTWQAHRQLAETVHHTIEKLLNEQQKTLHDIEGVICYKGPGSFTGLRIGMSVANALTHSLNIPGVATNGDDWVTKGIKLLHAKQTPPVLLPEYGGEINITQQKK